MKKRTTVLLVIGACLLAIVILGQITHLFEFYTVSNTSNEPTYNSGDIIIASKLKKPVSGSFIVFKRRDNTYIYRCIGNEGDIIEIRHTAVYINRKPLDEPYAANQYYIAKEDLKKVAKVITEDKKTIKKLNDSLSLITLTPPELKKYRIILLPYFVPEVVVNPRMYPDFMQRGFNEDNFGPVRVPKGCYFVLGDSRHDSFDSRYLGFVKAEDVISTVIK